MIIPQEVLLQVAQFAGPESCFLLSRLLNNNENSALEFALPCLKNDDPRGAWRLAAFEKSLILFRALNSMYRNFFDYHALDICIRADWLPGVRYLDKIFDAATVKMRIWIWIRDILLPEKKATLILSWFLRTYPGTITPDEWNYLVWSNVPEVLEYVLSLCPSLEPPQLEWALAAAHITTARWIIKAALPVESLVVNLTWVNARSMLSRIKLLHAAGISLIFSTSKLEYAAIEGDIDLIAWVYERRHDFPKINWSHVYATAFEADTMCGDAKNCITIWLYDQGVLPKRSMYKDVPKQYKSRIPRSAPVTKHICDVFGVDYTGRNDLLEIPILHWTWKISELQWLMKRFKLKVPRGVASRLPHLWHLSEWSKGYLARRLE